MCPTSAFRDELNAINQELRGSQRRIEALLQRMRSELAGAADAAEREHLGSVVRELERKFQEIRNIGLLGEG